MPRGWHTFLVSKEKSMIPSNNDQNKQRDNNNNGRKEQDSNNRQDIRQPESLSEQDLPESDNESTGAMGSGQRQDSN
jgi:hypothetical protein